METLSKYFITTYFIAYVVVAFLWPSLQTYKRTGVNPVTFGNTGSAHDFIGTCFKSLFALQAGTIVTYWISTRFYKYLLPVEYLHNNAVQWFGIILCMISLTWTSVAQVHLGKSWRIGIDQKNKTELKTSGLFSISRNPIFLGMVGSMGGAFLVIPNAVTLLVMVTGYVLIQIQIRLEEEFLSHEHGIFYEQYKIKVRRLL